MIKFSKSIFLVFVIICVLISGCNESELQEPISATLTKDAGDFIPTDALQAEENQVLLDSLEISDQPYLSPTDIYEINLPKDWNCSEVGSYQVDCQSPDDTAELYIRVTGTGYELMQEAFLSFSNAELISAYSDVKEYSELERNEDEGLFFVNALWREGETYWRGNDQFTRSGAVVLHVHTKSQQAFHDKYYELFDKVRRSTVILKFILHENPIYENRKAYTAPDAFFLLDIPTGWNKFTDTSIVEKTRVEGFLSPDKRASVQIAVYRHTALIDQALKGEKTLEIMRTLYGHDMRVSHDKWLMDGRERLTWSAERKDINGISYFDSYGSSLYVLSMVWENPTSEIYLPILEEIIASFTRE